MPRVLKLCALLLVNVVVALIASAIVESAIDRLIPTHLIAGVVQKQWALSTFTVQTAQLVVTPVIAN